MERWLASRGREVGGEYEALFLVSTADDLEEQVGVAIVEGEETDLVEDRMPMRA